MFESLIVGAVLPAVIDIVKGVGGAFGRKMFGLSVDDQIKLENAGVQKLEALAKLDNPYGTPSQWVIDMRASFRYISAAAIIAIGCGVLFTGVQASSSYVIEMGFTLVGMPFSFIFGERLYLGLKGPASK